MSEYEQHALECDEHGAGCTLIVGVRNGREVWRSHNTAELPAGTRLNLDHPTADRHRWQLANLEQAAIIGWTPEHHRRVAFNASERDLFTQQELAAIRDVLGVNIADLRAEANEKGWDK